MGWAGSVILDGGGGASREHASIVEIIVVVRVSLVRALAGHVRHGLNTKVVLVINIIALDAEHVQCCSVSMQTAAEDLVIGFKERMLAQVVQILSESMVQAKAVRIDEACINVVYEDVQHVRAQLNTTNVDRELPICTTNNLDIAERCDWHECGP